MDKIEGIHQTALRILREIGIRLHHPAVCDIVAQNGVRVEGDTAFFDADTVMRWAHKAPQRFKIHARNPAHDIVIGAGDTHLAPGYGCAFVATNDGSRREALLEDYIAFAKLVHQSAHIDLNGGILVQPWDVPVEVSHLVMLYAAAHCTDKCLLGISATGTGADEIMSLMAILFGGRDALRAKPRLITMLGSTSPLQYDEMTLETILTACRYGQPIIISAAPAAGTTGPIKIAANLALATAEILAGITISQMIAAGTPVVFGLQAYGADLRTGNIAIGSPVYALQAKYCAHLARKYGLPSRGGGANTDAKKVSVRSGYESMFTLLTAFQSRIDLIFHSAGILDSFAAMSYEQFMVDMEIIDMIKFYMADIEVATPDDFSFDQIKAVGPGGHFISAPDTLAGCRTYGWHPQIENMDARRKAMLADYRPPEIDPAVRQRLEAYLLSKGVPAEIIAAIGHTPSEGEQS